MITAQVTRLLARPEFAVLSTANRDGSHHVCVMWAGQDGDDLVMASRLGRRQVTNLAERPAATVLVMSRTNPLEYSEIRGVADVTPDERGELIDRLSHVYTGRGHVGLAPEDDLDRVRIRLRPTRITDHPRPR